jgi:serine/threonine protein kinase
MMTISGYENLRLIQKSSNTEIFAGNRTTDQKPVLLRTHRRDTVTPNQIANYQSEFTLLNELNSSYICKPLELLEHNDLPILVLEDTPRLTFKDYLGEYNPTYTDSIKIALSITRDIDYLHGKNIIHKNISPENIRLDPISLHATFFGFSIATHQTTMKHRPHESSHFDGRLSYISPEQTGRLNRTVDYRTDYYSLGILLYELVTGKPAFPLEDPLHSIYNHIVATPVSPLSLNSNVSKELDKVIITRPDLTSIKQSLQYELQEDIEILLELAPELDLLLEPDQTGVKSLAPIRSQD